MALQGTIQDFGLADIFQLIGIQRKTGILTLESGEELVSIKFLEGNVVGAENQECSIEDLLGSVLVRTGKITDDQLHEALRIQEHTLQRLGNVLVSSKFITEPELTEALRIQSLQIIYRLFRWREGNYSVQMVDNLDYDERHFVPISAETILMEGARMVDEWPIIERRIRNDRMVFERTAAASEVAFTGESLVETDIEFDFGFEEPGGTLGAPDPPPKEDKGVSLSSEEHEVLALVDGTRSVQAINDCCNLGDFDTFRILCELLTRGLIQEVARETQVHAAPTHASLLMERVANLGLYAALVFVVGTALFTLPVNPGSPWKVSGTREVSDLLRYTASHARLERIEQAIQVFYLDTGIYPAGLDLLAKHGYVGSADLDDPWGRAYGFQLSAGGYQLAGGDASGEPTPDLSVSHQFSAAQRMMIESRTEAEP